MKDFHENISKIDENPLVIANSATRSTHANAASKLPAVAWSAASNNQSVVLPWADTTTASFSEFVLLFICFISIHLIPYCFALMQLNRILQP